MAVEKSTEETLVLAGTREIWLDKCRQALREGGFSKIDVSPSLFQLQGAYKKVVVYGEILITLMPEGENTKIHIKATANMDNVFALFKSPTRAIITAFKNGIK